MKLILANEAEFEIAYGGPVAATEYTVFYTEILDSDMDTIHETFKDPENTETLTIQYSEEQPGDTYTGYTRYCGFNIAPDGGINVTLKKQL